MSFQSKGSCEDWNRDLDRSWLMRQILTTLSEYMACRSGGDGLLSSVRFVLRVSKERLGEEFVSMFDEMRTFELAWLSERSAYILGEPVFSHAWVTGETDMNTIETAMVTRIYTEKRLRPIDYTSCISALNVTAALFKLEGSGHVQGTYAGRVVDWLQPFLKSDWRRH